MRRTACAVLPYGTLAAVTAGVVLAGSASWGEAVAFWLLALLLYPLDRFLLYPAGWGPRPPSDQDRT